MINVRQAFTELYIPNRPGLAQTTITRYRDELSRWERLTTNPPLDRITTETFNLYRSACLKRGLKPSSVEGGIRTVLQVLRLCGPEQERRQGLGLIPKVPYVGQTLRCPTPFQPTPSVDDLRQAWINADAAIWPRTAGCVPRDFWRAWIGFQFATGLRIQDVLRAKRSQLIGDLLAITASKTGVVHVFPIPDWVLPLLYRLPTYKEKLFPCNTRGEFPRRELRRISKAAGVPKILPHGIRRCSITEWSAINSDCGAVIHGCGLGIRSRYVDPLRLLRAHVSSLPDLSYTPR